VLTVTVDVARVEAFLVTWFGGDSSDVVHLGTGVWSQAFAFRRAERDYVIRFGTYQEDFAKDHLAARYACPALPIPRVIALGEACGGYYAIAERVFGGYIDDVNETQMRALLPVYIGWEFWWKNRLGLCWSRESDGSSGQGIAVLFLLA
jgi:hypothetical protein